MRETRELRQRGRPVRRLAAHRAQEAAPAHLLAHPALEEGLRRGPQVEVRIELATESLDVEQRLLQHHELRLDLHVEAPRSLEEAQQEPPEVDLLQRPRFSPSVATRMFPGCMSAWKNPSRNTCVKQISTPARARALRSTPRSFNTAMRETGTPCMRSIVITRSAQRSQCTSGTARSGENSK